MSATTLDGGWFDSGNLATVNKKMYDSSVEKLDKIHTWIGNQKERYFKFGGKYFSDIAGEMDKRIAPFKGLLEKLSPIVGALINAFNATLKDIQEHAAALAPDAGWNDANRENIRLTARAQLEAEGEPLTAVNLINRMKKLGFDPSVTYNAKGKQVGGISFPDSIRAAETARFGQESLEVDQK